MKPLALMGSVDRDLIMATGSRCPMTVDRSLSIRRMTDCAITRCYPRTLPEPARGRPYAAATVAGRYSSPRTISAQAMRRFLLANATATTFIGLLASIFTTQGSWRPLFERR